MTSQQILKKIETKKGQFFKVSFRRKNDKKVNGVLIHKAGEIREILCRRGVKKFIKGTKKRKISANTVVVFDVQTYNNLRKTMPTMKAGQQSYRSFDLGNVITIS